MKCQVRQICDKQRQQRTDLYDLKHDYFTLHIGPFPD